MYHKYVFSYTAEEDFETADAVFDCIGDPPEVRFNLDFCANLLQKQYVSWKRANASDMLVKEFKCKK
jgi:hypothetical protein